MKILNNGKNIICPSELQDDKCPCHKWDASQLKPNCFNKTFRMLYKQDTTAAEWQRHLPLQIVAFLSVIYQNKSPMYSIQDA